MYKRQVLPLYNIDRKVVAISMVIVYLHRTEVCDVLFLPFYNVGQKVIGHKCGVLPFYNIGQTDVGHKCGDCLPS